MRVCVHSRQPAQWWLARATAHGVPNSSTGVSHMHLSSSARHHHQSGSLELLCNSQGGLSPWPSGMLQATLSVLWGNAHAEHGHAINRVLLTSTSSKT